MNRSLRGKLWLTLWFLGAVALLAGIQAAFYGEFFKQVAYIVVGLGTVTLTMTPLLLSVGYVMRDSEHIHAAILIAFLGGAFFVLPFTLKLTFGLLAHPF